MIDADSGKILAEKNGDKKKPPASLTKMMTVYVIASALKSGQIKFKQMRDQAAKHQIEEVGAKLRSMMPWIASNKLVKDI